MRLATAILKSDRLLALTEELLELAQRFVDFGGVRWGVSAGARLEVAAEVGASFITHFVSRGLAAMFGHACVVVDAHPADMQLGAALRASVCAHHRQTQR